MGDRLPNQMPENAAGKAEVNELGRAPASRAAAVVIIAIWIVAAAWTFKWIHMNFLR